MKFILGIKKNPLFIYGYGLFHIPNIEGLGSLSGCEFLENIVVLVVGWDLDGQLKIRHIRVGDTRNYWHNMPLFLSTSTNAHNYKSTGLYLNVCGLEES